EDTMQSSLSRKVLGATISIAIFTACGGSGSGGVPNAASSLATAQSPFGQGAGRIGAMSGIYTGTRHDSVQGNSRVQLYLSQSQSALGGALVYAEGSKGLAAIIAWTASGNSISGNGVGPMPGSSGSANLCTFSMIGTRKYRRISGSYSATYGCSGETGTFALWRKCSFEGTGSEALRPEGGVKSC
ncbi:MAG TPA: hypothetical protein VIX60_03200, partial [Candidatus Cybelea sp.]